MATSPHRSGHGRRKGLRFKKIGVEKKLKKGDELKEMETIAMRCQGLPKASTSTLRYFSDFPLSSRTFRALKELEYEEPTDIQRESLPFTLSGLDVVGAAKTGSGKTLALILPVLESLWRSGWSSYCGLGALIISPTRELALQTFTVINHVGKYHEFSCALLIGGTDVEYERSRVGKVNIIICTPGRLLQHMDENENFLCDQLLILVLDEADRILDMGFSQQINAIVANLPRERQTLLFSATQTRNVKDLSRVCTRDPVFVSAHEHCTHVTPDGLVQYYIICEDHDKLNTLWSFIINNKKSKVIVFVSSCKQARFLTEAFCHLRPGLPVMGLWGTMNQKKRVEVFQKFEDKEAAVMFATDVASRGLDFSDVNWVLQVDCPASVQDYIHRVGRTARLNQTGHAVLFLTSFQKGPMVTALNQANIPLTKQVADPRALVDVRAKMQAILSQFPELKQFAQKSIVAYLRSVFMMHNKKVFDVTTIDAAALAASYGLITVPRVRFLSKRRMMLKDNGVAGEKKSTVSRPTKEVTEERQRIPIEGFGVDERNDDILIVKKKDVFDLLKDQYTAPNDAVEKKTNSKVVTKISSAKKLLNKKLKVNTRKVYDENGEAIKVDGVVDLSESAGLDLALAKEAMKKTSVEDRVRQKALFKKKKKEELERKRKRRLNKGEDLDLCEEDNGVGSEVDLSFLPDPDEVRRRYGKPEGDSEDAIMETPASLRKRRKQRKVVIDTEKQALDLFNPFEGD
ncbi:hypothetical protein V3C99_003187 [Haemonchus contortus]